MTEAASQQPSLRKMTELPLPEAEVVNRIREKWNHRFQKRAEATSFEGLCERSERALQSSHQFSQFSELPAVVVFDDDPTGGQTMHDVSEYMEGSSEMFRQGLSAGDPLFLVLTDSRSYSEDDSVQLHREMAFNLLAAMEVTNRSVLPVLRGDSTLRGHFFKETDAVIDVFKQAGHHFDGLILCPYFDEGGRFTWDGVHFVKEGDTLVPSGQTEFAGDPTFGYSASRLPDWVEEKTHGNIRSIDVWTASLEEIRSENLLDRIMHLKDQRVLACDAVSPADAQAIALAIMSALAQGKHLIVRCAASLAQALGGMISGHPLSGEEMRTSSRNGGILAVGSYTEKTTRQLKALEGLQLEWIEMDASSFGDEVETELAARIDSILGDGRTVVLQTPRLLVTIPGREEQLAFSTRLANKMAGVVARMQVEPSFFIVKGGITSSRIAKQGLGIRRVHISGCALPGVPFWRIAEGTRAKGMGFVVFPGNVGDDDALHRLVKRLLEPGQKGLEL